MLILVLNIHNRFIAENFIFFLINYHLSSNFTILFNIKSFSIKKDSLFNINNYKIIIKLNVNQFKSFCILYKNYKYFYILNGKFYKDELID